MTYRLNKSFRLPDSLYAMKLGIVGRTGSGKTNTAVRMGEQMLEAGVPIVILDPQADWFGLRSHYPIVILGGEHADVPLEPTGGSLAADFVVNERVPVLLDLFQMGEAEMVRFATDFAKRLWQTNREALHVFIDEADLFAPQQSSSPDKAKCLSAWQNVIRRGRSRGIGATMITQRTAVINKDLLTQADPLIVHRLTAPQDLKAIDAYLGYHGLDKPARRGLLSDVAKLQRGEALVISPGEMEIAPTLVVVEYRKSFDSSATPEAGQTKREPKTKADVDLGALQRSMAETIEKAKANDPKLLQQRIRELEKQLAHKPAAVADDAALDRARAVAAADRDAEWQQREREWNARFAELEGHRKRLTERLETGSRHLREIADLISPNGEASPVERPVAMPGPDPVHRPVHNPRGNRQPPAPRLQSASHGSSPAGMSKAERKILIAFYWTKDDANVTPAKIGFYSGYSANSGGFNNALGRLRNQWRYLEGWTLTPEGEAVAAVMAEAKPAGMDLREWLRPKIGKCENEILDVLLNVPGRRLTNEQIAASTVTGYQPNSGGFNNAMGRLRTLEAIDGGARDGGTKAADVFFE